LRHHATPEFWRVFDLLPETVRDQARRNFQLLKDNPRHPSLRFKQVGRFRAVRVGRRYRALGVEVEDGVSWFWIGTHAEYDKLVG